MSTAAAGAVRAPQPGPPRLGVVRAAWRQHRRALAWLLLGAVTLITGLILSHPSVTRGRAWAAGGGCLAHVSAGCQDRLSMPGSHPVWVVTHCVALLPVLVSVFLGAPLLAREYEQGTHWFAWTQGTGPGGWVAGRLLALGAAMAAVAVTVALVADWWILPFEQAGEASRWLPGGFLLGVPVAAAWTFFTLCLGVLAGAVCRRTRLAMWVAAAGLYLAGRAVTALMGVLCSLAPRVSQGLPPLAGTTAGGVSRLTGSTGLGPPGSWVLTGWYTGPGGHRVSAAVVTRLVRDSPQGPDGPPRLPTAWLAQHHLTYWVSYQPASRFWLLQGLAAAVLLAAAALLAAATVWLIRWRPR